MYPKSKIYKVSEKGVNGMVKLHVNIIPGIVNEANSYSNRELFLMKEVEFKVDPSFFDTAIKSATNKYKKEFPGNFSVPDGYDAWVEAGHEGKPFRDWITEEKAEEVLEYIAKTLESLS